MAYDYNGFVTALASNIVIATNNADFVAQLPNFINNAELRIYRDLDLLTTVFRDPNGTVTVNQRSVPLPSTYGRFVVVEGVNVKIGGVRNNALVPVSRDFIDYLYPAETAPLTSSIPRLFARDSDQSILIAPSAGSAANVTNVEVVGTIRPTPLSSSNTTTFISQYLPDLFMASAMVQAAGWMKNYGAQADDPKQALSWDAVYAGLLPAAKIEENRKRFASGSWTSKSMSSSQPERI